MTDRITQINSLLLQEISQFFADEVPHVFVTVTKVTTNPDLKNAEVWVSFLNNRGSNMEELRGTLHNLRQHLRERLRMKFIPHLELKLDTGMEYAEHISDLIEKTKEDTHSA